MDYDVQRCTRHCSVTGRELAEGEEIFSTLVVEGAQVRRHDYAAEAWTGPPEGVVGWWKSRIPIKEAKKPPLAPSEVLLNMFRELEGRETQADLRYVLALLLVRRRLLRLEESETDEQSVEWLVVYCPRDGLTDRVRVTNPSDERTAEIEAQLTALLDGGERS
jgi:hypothetical protein